LIASADVGLGPNMELMHVQIDSCDVLRIKRDNNLVDALFGVFLDDFEKKMGKCPIKQGEYTINEVRPRINSQDFSLLLITQAGQEIAL
jgi:hypothetical protein